MTRDEAIYKIENTVVFSDRWAANYVDALAVLGLLKFDTPEKSMRLAVIDRLDGIIVTTNSAINDPRQSSMPRQLNREGAIEIVDILSLSGFKITR